ncbi:unnamed protein product [Phaedon cochleariae]|uniref:Protein stoned-A n=1 Tax=Phaedon cochleariae TaxID=80249 RepID=A0A9N9SHX9_PHACE|nr:unnamed protein product [Phaedon cochleariae]
MHKITKGLKKKKKGKKSKHKEEDLFKPEELENYRREHQNTSEEQPAQNEEWKKFLALTSEVDDILKKTQGDLDRIKSTSFFQRKPTESEVRKKEEERIVEEKKSEELASASVTKEPTLADLGIVEVSESESDEEEDDNLFDTTYLEALEQAAVKLAYIPDSPTENPLEGDDPFDTSIAERAILGPEVLRKGKKLVPLGAAVEVLTGRVELPTCATKRPTSRRQVLKERDLLLGSFDEGADLVIGTASAVAEPIPKTLLDEDPIPLPEAPIDLSNPIPYPQALPIVTTSDNTANTAADHSDILKEFDVTAPVEDEDDLEFEALAAESLSKAAVAPEQSLPINTGANFAGEVEWGAFDAEFEKTAVEDEEVPEVDPFDTAFADKVIPDLIPNKETYTDVAILANGNNSAVFEENSLFSDDRVAGNELNTIKPCDRDLLGGSNVDLSVSSIQPPQIQTEPYSDPFDNGNNVESLSDDDFDPRASEFSKERTLSRPDVLNFSSSKTVSFDLPSTEENAFNDSNKVIKPLTPFYTRKTSIAELPESDPFDTSFATNLAPGKAELKIIESELFDPNVERNLALHDKHFNPRDETRARIDRVIQDIVNPKVEASQSIDLLAIDNDIQAKVLTPGDANSSVTELSYSDPFDTSIAKNIQPGKTELKLLESQLIASPPEQKNSDRKVDDLLLQEDHRVIAKPLSPSVSLDFSPVINDDFDPFDTSCANNILPGRAELKVIESEFI